MSFARTLRKGTFKKQLDTSKNKFVLILDDVYDTFNVGGMYRIADAAGIQKIYHCGDTPLPVENDRVNSKIARASVGLYQYIAWEHCRSTQEIITELKRHNYTTVALEQDERSIPFDTYLPPKDCCIALIVGNETFGVDSAVLQIVDTVVELPMYGVNKSVNVVVATGIVAYAIRNKIESASIIK